MVKWYKVLVGEDGELRSSAQSGAGGETDTSEEAAAERQSQSLYTMSEVLCTE